MSENKKITEDASTPMCKKYAPGEPRPWQIGFGPVTVAPGKTVEIPAQPKVIFHSEKIIAGCGKGNLLDKLTWDSGGAEDLFVTQMFVGKESQLKEPIPFTDMTSGKPFDNYGKGFRESHPALTITFTIANLGTESRIVDLTIFGQCVL
jgi:hypothetical protein